jgi:thiol-disulfide isomerase/thioredoxin
MSKPIDQRNRGSAPGAARRPATPATAPRPTGSGGKGQPGTGTVRATTGKAGTARPGTRSTMTTSSRKPPARKGAAGGWKPLDLAIIFGFMVVVGVIIWFGLGGAGTGTPTNSAAGAANDAQSAASSNSPPPLAVNIGQAAPDFTLPATDGQTYSLSQFKGKVVLLEFMAPWCPHCQEDAPIFNQVHEAYKDKNVQLLAVNATGFGRNYENGDETPITMDDQIWFRDTFQVSYPMLFDKDVAVGQQYVVSHFPTVLILDTNGVVVATPDNPVTFESLSAALDQALQGTATTGTTGR